MSEPTNAPAPGQPMPTPTRVAVIMLALLGVLLLTNGVLTWLGREGIVDRIVDSGVDRAAAEQSVIVFLLSYTLIGAGTLLSSLFLPRRRRWARPVGVVATSALLLLSLFSVLASGGVPIFTLLVLVASAAGLTSLLNRQTKTWLRGEIR